MGVKGNKKLIVSPCVNGQEGKRRRRSRNGRGLGTRKVGYGGKKATYGGKMRRFPFPIRLVQLDAKIFFDDILSFCRTPNHHTDDAPRCPPMELPWSTHDFTFWWSLLPEF